MVDRRREFGADRGTLGALADERGFGARTEREPQRVEQDGLAGAGLSGHDVEPRLEREVEAIDQHDAANGEPDEHGRAV